MAILQLIDPLRDESQMRGVLAWPLTSDLRSDALRPDKRLHQWGSINRVEQRLGHVVANIAIGVERGLDPVDRTTPGSAKSGLSFETGVTVLPRPFGVDKSGRINGLAGENISYCKRNGWNRRIHSATPSLAHSRIQG